MAVHVVEGGDSRHKLPYALAHMVAEGVSILSRALFKLNFCSHSVVLSLLTTMPSLGFHSSSFQALCSSIPFQFAAPEASSCFCLRKNVAHFALPRPLGRARETPSSRILKMRAVERGAMREPFRMSLSAAESVSESDDVSALSHIMEPIHEGDTDLLLVHCPGALKASEKYFSLMHAIQAQSSLRLWIVVLHNTDQEALSSIQIDVSLTGVLTRLEERGFRGSNGIENVFLGGHSLGAWAARAVALRRAQGFIQMGSCFDPESDNLAQHPKPVLTLGGGRDGQMPPSTITKHSAEVVATEPDFGPHNTYAVKPVIIIPGMNHAQFCDGRPNLERGDLPATISLGDAQDRAGELVAAFLAVQSQGSTETGARGLETLTKAVEDTHRRYKVLWEALANQAGDAAAHQLHVASPSSLALENVTAVQHDFVDNFVISKPWIGAERNNQVFITTYLSPTERQGLCNLWVKMKLREAVLQCFPSAGDPASPVESLGKEVNSKTFEVALSLVCEEEREMFLKHGKKLRFVDDWLCLMGPVWIESDLSFTPTPSGDVEVQTPVLLSPMNVPPRFAGMHYMKVLTLGTALHWILSDSFR